MTINERFFYLLDKNGYSQKEFSLKTGIPTQTISGWKKRQTDPPAALISSIADFFGVSYSYMLTGKEIDSTNFTSEDLALLHSFKELSYTDKMKIMNFIEISSIRQPSHLLEIDKRVSHYVAESNSPYNTNISIPVLGYVAAGEPILSYELEYNSISPESSKASYALIAQGNSMDPVILDKEIIEVISTNDLENGEIGIIKVNDGVTCKRFYKMKDHCELKSINPNYDTIVVKNSKYESMQILGKVELTHSQKMRL